MRSISFSLIVVVFCAQPLFAQSRIEQSRTEKIADALSYATVVAQLAAATTHNIRSDDRKSELLREVGSIGITVGLSELVKRLIHEDRPDHSDNKSFWSEHTAIAASVSGWNNKIGISLTVGTGTGRIVARKHYIWDVLAGAGVGLLSQAVVSK